MSRFVLLDTGEELSHSALATLHSSGPPIRLRLCEPPLPFRDGQVVHVRRAGHGVERPADLLLCHGAGEFRLCARREARAGVEVVGRAIALQRGTTTVSVERALGARLPLGWLPRIVDALEVLVRFCHPLTPPLFQGSAREALARVRAKYDSAPEVRQYSRGVGAEALEGELVERHVRSGGRLLDIGCGAGREAIGFARAGFGVVAIDLAPGMIDAARRVAREEGLAIEFRVQSATELGDPPGSFDGAFCSGAYNHVPGRDLRIETLRRVGRALTLDGALILGVMYRGPLGILSRTRLVDGLRVLGARVLGPGRFSEPGDGWMRDVSEASDPRAPVFFHDFAEAMDVRREIEAAGLSAAEVVPGWWICRPAG